jgi:O-antigen/teichoic acid export membrane protein
MSPESTFRPALLLMAGRAVASAFTLLIPITLARVFNPHEYGTYRQLFLVFATLYPVALFGMSDSLYYFMPKDPAHAGRYVANALAGLAGGGAVCFALLFLFREPMAEWLGNGDLAGLLAAMGAFLLLNLVATVLEIVLIARKRYAAAGVSYVASDLLRACGLVLPALLFGSLEALMLGAVAFAALRVAATLVVLRRELGGELRPDAGILRAQLAYAAPFALYVLVDAVQATFHQYAVSRRFDAATFALYSVGCFQVPFVDFLATPASSVMMVRMAEELRAGRAAAALGIWRDVTRRLALVFFPMAALLMLASREVIAALFTERYAAAAPLFALFTLSVALASLQTDGLMRVEALIPYLVKVNLVRLALVATLLPLLLSALGLVGPVLAALTATAAGKALHLERFRRLRRLPLSELLPWRSLAGTALLSAASTLPPLLLRPLVSGPPLALAALQAAAFAAAYLGLAVATGLIRPAERAALGAWLRPWAPRALAAAD